MFFMEESKNKVKDSSGELSLAKKIDNLRQAAEVGSEVAPV